MNWKVIVGILIIFGGAKEAWAEMSDYNSGVTHLNPIYGELGCATFICLGIYLIYKGRQQKKTSK